MAITPEPWYRLRLAAMSGHGDDDDEVNAKVKLDEVVLEAKKHFHDIGNELYHILTPHSHVYVRL